MKAGTAGPKREETEMGGGRCRILRGLVTGAMALTMGWGTASVALADIGAPPVEHQGFAPAKAWFNSTSEKTQFAPAHSYFNGDTQETRDAEGLAPPPANTSITRLVALVVGSGLAGLVGIGLLVRTTRRRRIRPAHAG
jgi:hypothetical protein